MRSSDNNLRELFTEQSNIFEIPHYQRYYVWDINEINTFLKDATYCYQQNHSGNEYDHFFGQMIFREIDTDRSGRRHMEIVDGQQRLTTFELLVAAVYRLILSKLPLMEDNDRQKSINILKSIKSDYIVNMPHAGSVCRKLKLSERDNSLLISILTVAEDINNCAQINCGEFESQKRIYSSYGAIYNKLDTFFEDEGMGRIAEALCDFLRIVANNFSVVVITAENPGYNYALYQIVNDRGVLLTSAELLKARTMELLCTNNRIFAEVEEMWNDILNDPGEETTKYLSWYYTSRVFKTSPRKKLHEAFEENVFKTCGKHSLHEEEQQQLSEDIRDLYECIKLCRVLSRGRIPIDNINPQINDIFYALIVGLKNESSIPLFLNILKIGNSDIKSKMACKLTLLLSKFFFVAKTMSGIHANSITNVYNEIAECISSGDFAYESFEESCRAKIEQKNCMETFNAILHEAIYSSKQSSTSKYLLYILELSYASRTYTWHDILSRDEAALIHFERVTTEHIASKNGYGIDAVEITPLDRNKIGNLTIIGANVNNFLDDKTFEEKKSVYERSPFAMTREVALKDTWTNESFIERQQQMIELANQAFTI